MHIILTFSIKTSLFMVFTTIVVYAGGRWLDKVNTESEAYLSEHKRICQGMKRKSTKQQ